MRRPHRSVLIAAAAAAVLALGPTAAHAAANTAWRPVNECALLTVGGCKVTTVTGPTSASADDGSCAGDVGVSVKYTNGTVSSAIFAHQYVKVTGKNFSQYKVWKL